MKHHTTEFGTELVGDPNQNSPSLGIIWITQKSVPLSFPVAQGTRLVLSASSSGRRGEDPTRTSFLFGSVLGKMAFPTTWNVSKAQKWDLKKHLPSRTTPKISSQQSYVYMHFEIHIIYIYIYIYDICLRAWLIQQKQNSSALQTRGYLQSRLTNARGLVQGRWCGSSVEVWKWA